MAGNGWRRVALQRFRVRYLSVALTPDDPFVTKHAGATSTLPRHPLRRLNHLRHYLRAYLRLLMLVNVCVGEFRQCSPAPTILRASSPPALRLVIPPLFNCSFTQSAPSARNLRPPAAQPAHDASAIDGIIIDVGVFIRSRPCSDRRGQWRSGG